MKHFLLKVMALVLCLSAWPEVGTLYGAVMNSAPSPYPAVAEDGELRFNELEEDKVSYVHFWNGGTSLSSSWITINGFVSGQHYIRVQLDGDALSDGSFLRIADANGYAYSIDFFVDPEWDNGGFWISEDYLYVVNNEMQKEAEFVLGYGSDHSCSFSYTVSVYEEQNIESTPLASTQRTVYFVPDSEYPVITFSENRLSGALDEEVSFNMILTVPDGIFSGKSARLTLYPNVFTGDNNSLVWVEGVTTDSVGNYSWDIPSLQSQTYTLTVKASGEVVGSMAFQLNEKTEDGDIGNILASKSLAFAFPSSYSEEDVAALKKMAEDNPLNKDLADFIENKTYEKDLYDGDGYNVGVTWTTDSPQRVKTFFIDNYSSRDVTTLDFSALTELLMINLNGTLLTSLDLSAQTKLNILGLNGNNDLYWDHVTLPTSHPDNFNVYGSSLFRPEGVTGTDYSGSAASGTEIDLSRFATVDGVASTYQWYLIDQSTYLSTETTMEAVDGRDGVFILKGNPGEIYRCEVTNSQYGEWRIQTPEIKITRDGAVYSETDLEGLRKLAADNPDVTQLQEFVDSKGWEVENWDNYSDVICTDWTTVNGETRLTHLRITYAGATITKVDLSPFTELRHFECTTEKGMDISSLDLSNNTKLEGLYVYSKSLESLDLSSCPNLTSFQFGTPGYEYADLDYPYGQTHLSSLDLSGCTQLNYLYLEHAHIKSLDLSAFSQLRMLTIDNCQELSLTGWEQLSDLRDLVLSNTTQFADIVNNVAKFTRLQTLDLVGTMYDLPVVNNSQLESLGIPLSVTEVDLNDYPNLNRFLVGWNNKSPMTYSGIKNYRNNVYFNGESLIQLTSPSHPEDPYRFENGDIIDLSEYASYNGKETVFMWVDGRYGIEEKNAFQPVDGEPGKFVLNSTAEQYGDYYCILMHPDFCEITDINVVSGWRMRTSWFHVETGTPQVYHEGDLQILSRIISESGNADLTAWWNEGCWQTGENIYNAQALWNKDNPRRLTELYIYNQNQIAETVDLSGLDSLQILSFTGSQVKNLTLPNETSTLYSLMLGGDTLLTSLNVLGYTALEHLDIQNTRLQACDVRYTPALKELYMQHTAIPGIETTAPEIARQLTEYGVPSTAETIDLANFPALQTMRVEGTNLTFSKVLNPHSLTSVVGNTEPLRYGTKLDRYSRIGETLGFPAEMEVNGTSSTIAWQMGDGTSLGTEASYTLGEGISSGTEVIATLTNTLFPGWVLSYMTTAYTRDGDANLDGDINVQDVVVTVNYLLKNTADIVTFGAIEADVNYNDRVDAADLTGIVNLVNGVPSTLRSALYTTTVQLSLDEKGMLSVNSQVPLTSLYLEMKGADRVLPLLGKAALLTQASSLHGDTLRIIAYSLDGKSIPSGTNLLAQLPAGVQLLDASFGDQQANLLRADENGMPTANEKIRVDRSVKAIYNSPNPFQGTTTFCYTLDEAAAEATIRIFSSNGAQAATLQTLPADSGMNRYTATLSLPAGVYYYRLETRNANGAILVSESNTLIIK